MDKLNKVSLLDDGLPVVGWNIDHRAQQFKHEIRIFSALLDHHCVVLQMLDKSLIATGVELRDISYALEQEGVAELAGTRNHLIKLPIGGEHLCVTLVRGQVHSQGDQLLAHDGLRTVDDQLVDQRDAIGESESGLGLILQTEVVQQLDYLSPKSWSLERVDELGNHTCICHLDPDVLVKRKIEQSSESDLQKKGVVAWNKSIQLLDNSLVFHFIFVFAENTQFFQKIEHNEKQIWIIPLQHGHEE
jgi:hypothetical protein